MKPPREERERGGKKVKSDDQERESWAAAATAGEEKEKNKSSGLKEAAKMYTCESVESSKESKQSESKCCKVVKRERERSLFSFSLPLFLSPKRVTCSKLNLHQCNEWWVVYSLSVSWMETIKCEKQRKKWPYTEKRVKEIKVKCSMKLEKSVIKLTWKSREWKNETTDWTSDQFERQREERGDSYESVK